MSDLVKQLRQIQHTKDGQIDWLPPNGWAAPLSKLCGDAADEIERLRSLLGAVTPGQSVADIKDYLRNVPKKELSSDAGERTTP